MDKQEKIVCAAVSLYVIPLENWHAEPFDHVFKVIDYEDYKEENLYRNLEILGEPVFGFFTSKKRFVDPVEAQKIAIACGQYRDPHARIKSLEESIEIGWDSVKYAKTGVMISSLKKRIAEDQETLNELKAGYLGNALRVEDLYQ